MSVSNKSGSKFLFYPRSYNKRGEINMHSMIGMTESGEIINVKLRIPDKHSENKNAPSIVEFSRNDYRAKMACIPTDDNGPENPEGILLLSGCQKEGSDKSKNIDIYIARWADVICADSQSPRYFSGLSRMMIYPFSNEVVKLRGLLDRAEKSGDTEKAQKIQEKIDDPVNWSYPVILYYPEKAEKFHSDGINDLIDVGASMIDEISQTGPTGGVALRAVNSEGQIEEESYCETYARYIVGENRSQCGIEVMEALSESTDWEKYKGYSWEIFPIGKVNSGPVANKMYSKDENYSFVERYFYENDKPRVCHGIVRVTYNEDANLTLLSKYFALSKPVGDPAKLDKDGGLSRIFEGEKIKLAHLTDGEAIIPRKDVIEPFSEYQARAMWMFAGVIEYSSFVNMTEASDPLLKHGVNQPQKGPDLGSSQDSSYESESLDNEEESLAEEYHDGSEDNQLQGDDEIEISFDVDDGKEEHVEEAEVEPVGGEDIEDSSLPEDDRNNTDEKTSVASESTEDVPSVETDAVFPERREQEGLKKPAKPAHQDSPKGVAAFLKKAKKS